MSEQKTKKELLETIKGLEEKLGVYEKMVDDTLYQAKSFARINDRTIELSEKLLISLKSASKRETIAVVFATLSWIGLFIYLLAYAK